MQIPLATALVIAAILTSAALVFDREGRWSPIVALGAAVVQGLMLFGFLDFLRNIWRIDYMLPAAQFIAGYNVWAGTTKKPTVTASTVLIVVTMIELLFLLGRIR